MDDVHSKQVWHFLTRQLTDLKVVVDDLDLPNGSVMRSIGTRGTRLCLRTYIRA